MSSRARVCACVCVVTEGQLSGNCEMKHPIPGSVCSVGSGRTPGPVACADGCKQHVHVHVSCTALIVSCDQSALCTRIWNPGRNARPTVGPEQICSVLYS